MYGSKDILREVNKSLRCGNNEAARIERKLHSIEVVRGSGHVVDNFSDVLLSWY